MKAVTFFVWYKLTGGYLAELQLSRIINSEGMMTFLVMVRFLMIRSSSRSSAVSPINSL